ncbi:glutathione S-transferase family protein [Pseudovibrio exalbescens]|uniref:glutathione S-transferase family protein n=1 Tax=Pseudovibrio exalbescens TaxID=197461 RepID=UPI002365A9A5|nr:glutathione S-transferase family protein [Pseudovibrio exalbescens]MDD7909499.1 glutathione S-transferase family protein [Pseudovibrio exalbescens]
MNKDNFSEGSGTMYRVIGAPFTRTFRVMWVLEEIAAPYEIEPEKPRSDLVRSLNPTGKVPVLVDDGQVITDSTAICQYLCDKHEALTFPVATLERAKLDAALAFANTEMDGILWAAAKHSFALPKELRVPAAKKTCLMEWETQTLPWLKSLLADNTWICGDQFSLADVFIGHCLDWAMKFKFPAPLGSAKAYVDRLHARPAYQSAIKRGLSLAQ